MIFLARCADFSPAFFEAALPRLPQEKRTAVQNIKHTLSRQESILGWAMLQLERNRRNLPPDAPLRFSPHGKPYYDGEDLHFSISHSGGFVCLTVADAPVGVDIQTLTLGSDAVQRRVLSDAERAALAAAADKRAAFTVFWTCKESYLKYAGTGISDDLRPLDFSPALSSPRFSFRNAQLRLWQTADYVLTVCADDGAAQDLIRLSPESFSAWLRMPGEQMKTKEPADGSERGRFE